MTYSSPLDREEGFTGAFNRTPWGRKFAWLPIRLNNYPPRRAWLRWVEVKRYGAFGIPQFTARLPDTAQGIEAGTAKTVKQGLAHESGGPDRDAPKSNGPSPEGFVQ